MFLKWWLRQLKELLPGSWVRNLSGHGDAAIVQVERDRAILLIRRKGHIAQAAQSASDEDGFRELAAILSAMEDMPRSVILRFPAGMLLSKAVSFPIVARRNLDTLLGFEMDRETPFARDEVHWTYRVVRQDPASGRLEVDLLIVPRAYVDPAIETARRAGLQANSLDIETEAHGTVSIRIGAVDRWGWLRSDRRLMALSATAGVLLLLAIVTPFLRQQIALAWADRTIDLLTEQARQAASLRKTVDQTASAISFINKERERDGSVVAALAITTRLVPDDSYLTSLSLRGGRLTISGFSPSAAHVVDLLAQSPAFREPTFDSPVVQNGANGLETFTVSATLTRAPGS